MTVLAGPEDLLTLDALQTGVLVGEQPAITQPQKDVTVVEGAVGDAVNSLLIDEGHYFQLFYLLRFQVEYHDALARQLLLDEHLADEHDLGRIKGLFSFAESHWKLVPSPGPFEHGNQNEV